MSPVPAQPKLYHITHVDNLSSIVADAQLWSDANVIARGGPTASIGMNTIKQRRLSLPVKCHPGDSVGDHVPFYFCPRSIMLYLLYRRNHPELIYTGGQGPIIHLEVDLYKAVEWANSTGHRWAFTLSNAGAVYTEFRSQVDQLSELNWTAIASTDFQDATIKHGKQAEFLVRDFCPWHLVERIGVHSTAVYRQVMQVLFGANHRPRVEVRQNWYY